MELESILLPGIEAKRPIVIAGPCSTKKAGDTLLAERSPAS